MRSIGLVCCVLSTLVFTGCGGSSSSSSSSGSSGSDIKVSFLTGGQTALETVGQIIVSVLLSEASEDEVTAPFVVGGSATNFVDYQISASPVVFAAGETFKSITVTIVDDGICEPDETIQLLLGAPTGATVMSPSIHNVAIPGVFMEIEPNDDVNAAAANGNVGTMSPGAQCNIQGNITPTGGGDDFDVFQVEATSSTTVTLNLVPASPGADIVMLLTDSAGNTLQGFDTMGPGGAETGQFQVNAGDVFMYSIFVFFQQTDYTNITTGVSPLAGPGSDTEMDPLFTSGYPMEYVRDVLRHRKGLTGADGRIRLFRSHEVLWDAAAREFIDLETTVDLER